MTFPDSRSSTDPPTAPSHTRHVIGLLSWPSSEGSPINEVTIRPSSQPGAGSPTGKELSQAQLHSSFSQRRRAPDGGPGLTVRRFHRLLFHFSYLILNRCGMSRLHGGASLISAVNPALPWSQAESQLLAFLFL